MQEPIQEPLQWLEDGSPYSARFDDVYRSRSGGLAQARHVFLGGCDLPNAWQGAKYWCVLETGFGLGLNFLATWAAWRLDPRRCEQLHFVSIEAYPVAAQELVKSVQALQMQTDDSEMLASLPTLSQHLASEWATLQNGLQTWSFEQGRVKLTLAVGDVRTMLDELTVEADSVYLDGFNPARNPHMWEEPTLQRVAKRCRKGTRIATFTVASMVLNGLKAQGFEMQKRPGLPPKWGRLEGVMV